MLKIEVDKILKKNEFSAFIWIESRLSIADLYKPKERCGIYIFRFKDEQYYIGQEIES